MALFDFLIPVRGAIEEFIIHAGLTTPPWSGVFLIFISLLLSSISGALNRALLDLESLTEKNEEMKKHQANKKKAMETADKKLWIQVKRNEDHFMELQRSTMMTRMLPSFITMGPFIFVFTTLRAAFQQVANFQLNDYCYNNPPSGYDCATEQGRHGALVVLPFKAYKLPLIGKWFSPYAGDTSLAVAGFSGWYFLSAIVVSTLFQRIFGFNLTGMQNPGRPGAMR